MGERDGSTGGPEGEQCRSDGGDDRTAERESPGSDPSEEDVSHRRLYDALPDPTLVVDPEDWRIDLVNDAATDLFDTDREDLRGSALSSLVPDADDGRHRRLLERAVGTDRRSTRTTADDGVAFHVLAGDRKVPVEASAETVELGGSSSVQVTLRRAHDEEVLEGLQSVIRDLQGVGDESGIAAAVGRAAAEVLDAPDHGVLLYDEREDVLEPAVVSETGPDVLDPPPAVNRGETQAWDAFEREAVEVSGPGRADPTLFDAETRVRSELLVPIGDHGLLVAASREAGEFDATDVSLAKTLAASAESAFERVESERQLREQGQQLRTIIDNVPIVLFAFDADGVFTVSEGKGLERLGLGPNEVVGESVFDLYEGQEAIVGPSERALSGEPVHSTAEVGSLVFETWYHPILDDDGEVWQVIGTAIEVTERERRERLVRVLNRFLRHNLRNAMNVIVGYAQRIEDHEDPLVRESVDQILATGDDVSRLSEKARRLSRLVAEDREITSVDVRKAVEDVVADVEEEHDATLTCRNVTGDPLPVDRTVELAIHEVVENAVKHVDGPDPRATISVTERPDRGEAVVHVVDDGPGLPEQERAVLNPDGTTQLNHGSGLGLFVAYWALADAGGTIEVQDASDQGTTIALVAPIVEDRDRQEREGS